MLSAEQTKFRKSLPPRLLPRTLNMPRRATDKTSFAIYDTLHQTTKQVAQLKIVGWMDCLYVSSSRLQRREMPVYMGIKRCSKNLVCK